MDRREFISSLVKYSPILLSPFLIAGKTIPKELRIPKDGDSIKTRISELELFTQEEISEASSLRKPSKISAFTFNWQLVSLIGEGLIHDYLKFPVNNKEKIAVENLILEAALEFNSKEFADKPIDFINSELKINLDLVDKFSGGFYYPNAKEDVIILSTNLFQNIRKGYDGEILAASFPFFTQAYERRTKGMPNFEKFVKKYIDREKCLAEPNPYESITKLLSLLDTDSNFVKSSNLITKAWEEIMDSVMVVCDKSARYLKKIENRNWSSSSRREVYDNLDSRIEQTEKIKEKWQEYKSGRIKLEELPFFGE